MATTLLQLRSTVRSRLGIPATDSFTPSEVIDEHVNLALGEFEEERRWPWQERVVDQTTPDATGDLAVPSDWRATRGLFYQPNNELKLVSLLEIYRYVGGGAPAIWALDDTTIKLRAAPPAGSIITHVYFARPEPLTEDTDVPQIPSVYSPAIIAKACELLQIRAGENTSAANHAASYDRWVVRARKDTRRSTGPTTPRIREGSWV